MALLKHKGGSFQVTGTNGKPETIHYGPGLNKSCPLCLSPRGKLCTVMKGKRKGSPAHETHKERLTD
jgi:hypothetical protein